MEYDMVFEGGGAKGMAFVGALQQVEKLGHTPARLMGASAGAIMATFLAAGYSASEMAEALSEKEKENGQPVFLGFLENPPQPSKEEIKNSLIRQALGDVNLKFIPDFIENKIDDAFADALVQSSSVTCRLYSFTEKGGLFAANNFLEWLRSKLNAGIYPYERGNFGKGMPRHFGNMTLAEYYAATGAELTLIGSDTTAAQILILNHNTAPDCPIVWAVRMSMSFPLLWQEVVWQPEWGYYRGKDVSGHTVVDGGMLSNFPIELFLSNEDYVIDIMGKKVRPGLNVLGFLIDESIQVPGAQEVVKTNQKINFSKFPPVERVMKLINTMTQAHDKIVIESHEKFVVRLPAKGYGTVEFGMSEARRNALVEAGRNSTNAYFERIEQQPVSRDLEQPGKPAATDTIIAPANKIATKILDQ